MCGFSLSPPLVTLHIFDHSNVTALDSQIRNNNNSTFNGFKDYFLINLPPDKATDQGKIAQYFASTPLKYNSLTFAFVVNKGKYLSNITNELYLKAYTTLS